MTGQAGTLSCAEQPYGEVVDADMLVTMFDRRLQRTRKSMVSLCVGQIFSLSNVTTIHRFQHMPKRIMAKRLDEIIGTNEEYVSYLERELRAARQTLHEEDSRITKRKRSCDPYWMTCAKQLVRQTPMSQGWTSSLEEHGIDKLLKSGDVITCLLDTTFESRLSARISTAEVDVIDETDDETTASLRMYARTTSMRLSSASTALALANFQKFLVISACAVLMEGDTPAAKVYEIVRICVGNKSTDQYCKRTLASAKCLNQLIDFLDIHDWGQRAAELLLLCGSSGLSHSTIAHAFQGIGHLLTTSAFLAHQ